MARMNEVKVLPYQEKDWFEKDLYFSQTATLKQPSPPTRTLHSVAFNKKRKNKFLTQNGFVPDSSGNYKNTLTTSINLKGIHWIEVKFNFLKQTIACYDGTGIKGISDYDGTGVKGALKIKDDVYEFIIPTLALFYLEHNITNFKSWEYMDMP